MAAAGERGAIVSRVIRTWGASESGLAEVLEGRIEALDAKIAQGGTETVTIAFLASGIEGIKCRLTARAATTRRAEELLDAEEVEVRSAIGEHLGDIIFGVDDQNMERAVADLLVARGLSLGVVESLTGGMIASRLVDVEGASAWFRGGVVAYATDVKHAVLGVSEGPVVSERAASEMAEAARRVLGADVGLAITGVAGPASQDGRAPGTVYVGVAMPDAPTIALELRLPGARNQVRGYAVISALDLLRRALLGSPVLDS
jgi:nicotinamide-nucleotide amidase